MDLRQEPRRQPRAAGGLDPPGRSRNPAFAGSPGGTPRGRSLTGRPRLGGSRLPSSSATVGTRTGDIASRSPPSRARSARTVPRAPARSVLPFPPRRTTPGPAGWRTTTPGILAPGPARHPEAPVPGPVDRHHADIPAGDGGGPLPRPPKLRGQPVHLRSGASPYRPVRDASAGSPTARIQPVPLTCGAA